MRTKPFLLGAALLIGLVALSFRGLALADQSAPSKSTVLNVFNPNVTCFESVPGPQVTGDLGRTIVFSAQDPIEIVTVTSGAGAVVVSSQFDTTQGQITMSKGIISYTLWTCPPMSTTTSTTSATTSTTSATTPTTSTTTPTTSTT